MKTGIISPACAKRFPDLLGRQKSIAVLTGEEKSRAGVGSRKFFAVALRVIQLLASETISLRGVPPGFSPQIALARPKKSGSVTTVESSASSRRWLNQETNCSNCDAGSFSMAASISASVLMLHDKLAR